MLVGVGLRIVMPRNRNGTEHSGILLSPVKIAYMRGKIARGDIRRANERA